MSRTLRLLAAAWLQATAHNTANLGQTAAFSFNLLADAVKPPRLPAKPRRRPAPAWLGEAREVRGPEVDGR